MAVACLVSADGVEVGAGVWACAGNRQAENTLMNIINAQIIRGIEGGLRITNYKLQITNFRLRISP